MSKSDSTSHVHVLLPVRAVNGQNVREHWRARHRRSKKHIECAYYMTSPVPLPCVVTLTRIGPQLMDGDGNVSSLKHVQDGVAKRLGVDDADPRVQWRYEQQKGREHGVIVDIRRMEDEAA